MIVKNETAILARCLGAVAPHIACWVIGDTGSTDGTQDLIRTFFAERGIPGELHEFPFVDFGQARNEALDRALRSRLTFDYLLLCDADMELVVEDAQFRNRLEAPYYDLMQRSGVSYWNARIVRRDAQPRYRGVTHEHLQVTGGGKQLTGVWYRDHASGSNRKDKIERDTRLLTEGLAQEPENKRYWFYFAQTHWDAGRLEEAAQAYAKRAAMGGWSEEVWYARLQRARCLKRLGNHDGFLGEAIAAFNQRPHRGEPLYDLARFYRERGMHEAAALFAEAGLALPWPKQDLLFVDDAVYTGGLREEYSISANYSRDRARKDRGFAACNWLALSRAVGAGRQGLARFNLRFYVEPAGQLMPSFAARPVGFAPPKGYRVTNPSVAYDGHRLVMTQSCIKDASPDDGRRVSPDGDLAPIRHYLLQLGAGLEVETTAEILPALEMASPIAGGLQEHRLIAWRGALWLCASIRDAGSDGFGEQMLARIDVGASGERRLTEWRMLRAAAAGPADSNWMPCVQDDALHLIQLCDPTRVLDSDARVVVERQPAIAADAFRGGTQALAFDGGWLVLVLEVVGEGQQQICHHRFVRFGPDWTLQDVSRPFYFRKLGAESACGLAWHPDGTRLVVSFAVAGRQAWTATMDARDVRALLCNVTDLPSGAPRPMPEPEVALAAEGRQVRFPASQGDQTRRPPAAKAKPRGPLSARSVDTASTRARAPTRPAKQLRFHILGIPHTASNKEYVACAYTQKVVKLCRMLKERGHVVFHYGNEASDVVCDEHVTVTTQEDLVRSYGVDEWKSRMFRFDAADHAYQTFYRNSIAQLATRKESNDFLLCMWGSGHKTVADAHSDMIVVEPGIGYARGHFANFRVFESYAMFHAQYGAAAVERAGPHAYHVVIPNFFNLEEFEFSAEKQDYFLYLGRVIAGKGVHIALQVADRIGARLVVAGQGSLADVGYPAVPPNVEFVGFADLETRKRLMSNAKGLFLPSQYIEPFGGVQIEALLSGTPTITSDWGAFAENNVHGVTGYRCRTFDHFVWAAQNIGRIDPHACRRWAEENFSVERIGEMYEEYFQSVMDIYTGKGWYELHPERTNLDWLAKRYPEAVPAPIVTAPVPAEPRRNPAPPDPPPAKRLLFYSDTKWALGAIHAGVCTQLRAAGWTAEVKSWSKGYNISEFAREASTYDYVVTLPNAGTDPLKAYHVPPEKIIVVAHDESDLQKLIAEEGVEGFERFAAYGVVSDTLACSSISLGIKRLPLVVRYGVDVDRYRRDVPARLSSVGYATVMQRSTASGVERKRGALAQDCAEAADLRFVAVEKRPFETMPDFYGTVDSLIMPSLQEGAGLPPLEAAAAGRLVIGTPVGHFPRLAYEGLGILAPLDAGGFRRFTVETLIYYRDNPAAFADKCASIQQAAGQRDWRYTIADWIELFSSAH
jgi:glycosyltransferase involved in cell wall biosynthesis